MLTKTSTRTHLPDSPIVPYLAGDHQTGLSQPKEGVFYIFVGEGAKVALIYTSVSPTHLTKKICPKDWVTDTLSYDRAQHDNSLGLLPTPLTN